MEGIKVGEQLPTVPTTLETPGVTVKNTSTSMATFSEEELIRIEFYKTYDVMIGVRIAATLGGFFSMMILLVLYKNYCKPAKTLSEEKLNAAVSAAVEEEDRALAAALEATSFYSSLSKQRQSLGSLSAPSSQPRFSSAGGQLISYTPPEGLFENQDDLPSEGEYELRDADHLPDYYACSYLNVPIDRRHSSITCSSGDTSYLERRGSAFEMGHPADPCCLHSGRKKLPVPDEQWDFYYPIDIQVIQPTPQISPSTSEQTLYQDPGMNRTMHGLQVPSPQDRMHRLTVDRSEMGLAPLASISSLGSFSSNSSPLLSNVLRNIQHDEDLLEESQGSDSVFVDDMDTEDEVDEFETDSEIEDGFDDDYSFCEASRRPISRCERQPRFASFDSCDMSVAADSECESVIEATTRTVSKETRRPHGPHDTSKPKRRLMKTNSEPRHNKQLPPWVERGRSGYVPQRQLSMPSRRKVEFSGNAKGGEEGEEETKNKSSVAPPCSESSSSSPTLKQIEVSVSQGKNSDMPSSDKRARFQKQKTIQDGGKSLGLLAPPSITVFGSCERLNRPPSSTSEFSSLPPISLQVEQVPEVILPSRSSSQETLC